MINPSDIMHPERIGQPLDYHPEFKHGEVILVTFSYVTSYNKEKIMKAYVFKSKVYSHPNEIDFRIPDYDYGSNPENCHSFPKDRIKRVKPLKLNKNWDDLLI